MAGDCLFLKSHLGKNSGHIEYLNIHIPKGQRLTKEMAIHPSKTVVANKESDHLYFIYVRVILF